MWINFTGFLARNRAAVPLPYSCCCYCWLLTKKTQKANKWNQTRGPASTAWHTCLWREVVKWPSPAQPRRANTTPSQSPPQTMSCPCPIQTCGVKMIKQQWERSQVDKSPRLSHPINGPNNFAKDTRAKRMYQPHAVDIPAWWVVQNATLGQVGMGKGWGLIHVCCTKLTKSYKRVKPQTKKGRRAVCWNVPRERIQMDASHNAIRWSKDFAARGNKGIKNRKMQYKSPGIKNKGLGEMGTG